MIDSFSGGNRFLSNFYPAEVMLDGLTYPSVEHAYQAAKSLDAEMREHVRHCHTAGEAKKAGRWISLRPDWEVVKVDVMRALLRDKFSDMRMAALLLATGDEVLVEGNTWGDTYWGQCHGVGQNWLGRLLMEVRAELKARRPGPPSVTK